MNFNESDKILIGLLAIAVAIYLGLSEMPQQRTEYEICFENVAQVLDNPESAAIRCAPK
ncbi:hypothetical protein N9C68_00530 [Gammaproteobacteria bacterium]|jgi:hypothetical protein|nr:hypothetical protein [Gammaproteobacteria bacterium]